MQTFMGVMLAIWMVMLTFGAAVAFYKMFKALEDE